MNFIRRILGGGEESQPTVLSDGRVYSKNDLTKYLSEEDIQGILSIAIAEVEFC